MKSIGLYLNSEPFTGGAYQYTLSIIQALNFLDQKSYKVICFCHSPKWNNLIPEDFENVILPRYLILRILSRIYKLIDRSNLGWVRFAWLFNPIIKKIDKSDCHLIIFPNQDSLSYQIKKKSLSTIHDLMHRYEPLHSEYQKGAYEYREKHYKLICKFATGILVDSNIGKKHVIDSYKINPKKVFVLPFIPPTYLLNTNYVNIKFKYQLPDKYIFYPAQFWEHKNHFNLLKAIKLLIDKGYDINLVLVGSKKNNFEKVQELINELNINKNVFILGYVNNDEMAALYKNSIATTFISLIGPTNIPPLEALLMGSPLICSNLYAMPEQVGNAALLVDPRNPKDIAEKVQQILLNTNLRKELINNGNKVIEKFTLNNFSNSLEGIINSLI